MGCWHYTSPMLTQNLNVCIKLLPQINLPFLWGQIQVETVAPKHVIYMYMSIHNLHVVTYGKFTFIINMYCFYIAKVSTQILSTKTVYGVYGQYSPGALRPTRAMSEHQVHHASACTMQRCSNGRATHSIQWGTVLSDFLGDVGCVLELIWAWKFAVRK